MDHGRVNYARSIGRRPSSAAVLWRALGNREGLVLTPATRGEQQQIANIRRALAQGAKQEHYRMGACFRGMADPFHRAEAWRHRANQLRNLAGCTRDPVASTSLDLMAEALDQHARKLEEMALKMHCTRRARLVRATMGRDLQIARGTAD
jgi:hypothetical protein